MKYEQLSDFYAASGADEAEREARAVESPYRFVSKLKQRLGLNLTDDEVEEICNAVERRDDAIRAALEAAHG